MSRWRRLAPWILSIAAVGGACRLEDHTPSGTRRDEDTIQRLVTLYARDLSARDWPRVRALFWEDASYAGVIAPGVPRGGVTVPIDSALESLRRALAGTARDDYDVRVLRSDLRQEGDLAAVWATTRRRTPGADGPSERVWVEHLLLRRVDGEWRILNVAATPWPRRR